MDITMHALERAVERLGVSYDAAPRVLKFIYEHGHTPRGGEWGGYGIIFKSELIYRAHAARMVIVNPYQGLGGTILTVVVPYFCGEFKYPNIRALRGLSVRDALRRYRQ